MEPQEPASTSGLTADESLRWDRDGYFVRPGVFSADENDQLRQVAEDIALGKRKMPMAHIDRNALVRDGHKARDGIHGMHKIHHPSCYIPEFLARVRDPRLTDPLVDILGPDILGINNLFIWKAPEVGLGFPWHQDKFYFGKRFKTATTIGTWTAIDAADRENGCLYVIPGSHKQAISVHDDIEGSQQNEFKLARDARDEDGIAVEVPPGAVIWFHSHLLHKSTDNHSQRFRRSYVSHYLSAQAEWAAPDKVGKGQPIMWIRGQTFAGKIQEVEREILPIPAN
jgi:phytanoyl-CoA hydroxylase